MSSLGSDRVNESLIVPSDKCSFGDFEELSSLLGFKELVVVFGHSIEYRVDPLFINGKLVFKPQLKKINLRV